MLQEPFTRIGVRELARQAHVSRSTFYAYYGNTDELLEEVEDTHIQAIARLNASIIDPTIDAGSFYSDTLAYVSEHADDFRAMLVTSPDVRFQQKWKGAVRDHLKTRRSAAGKPALSNLALEVASSAVVAAFAYHLANPGTVRTAEAISLLSRALSALDG